MTESTPTIDETAKDQNKLFARAIRGYAIIAKGKEPKHLAKEQYQISSQNGNGKYIMAKNDSRWTCTCPDHIYRKVDCKHINAVRLWLKLKEKMESADVFDLPKAFEDISKYEYYGSIDVVKWGSRQNKRNFESNWGDSSRREGGMKSLSKFKVSLWKSRIILIYFQQILVYPSLKGLRASLKNYSVYAIENKVYGFVNRVFDCLSPLLMLIKEVQLFRGFKFRPMYLFDRVGWKIFSLLINSPPHFLIGRLGESYDGKRS
ncbi:MAG: SWIM zinc finger family protein [Nitrososphaerales archaeon]